MSNNSAWQLGAEIASKNIAARRNRRDLLVDEERQKTVSDLYSQGHELSKTIAALGEDDPKRDAMTKQLADVERSIANVYHPQKNPNAADHLRKDWGMLANLIHRTHPAFAQSRATLGDINFDPTVTPAQTITPEAQSVTLAATPGYQPGALRAGALPGAKLPEGAPLPPSERGTIEQAISLPSAPVTIPRSTYNVRPAAATMTPQQRQTMAQRDAARKKAGIDIAAAGGSAEQQARSDAAGKMALVKQAVLDYNTLNPSATSQQKSAFLADLVEKTYGIAQKPVYKEFIGPDGQKDWLDVTQPVPPGWNATGTENADTRTRADFDAYKRQHPEYTGTLQQWKVEQGQLGKIAVPTNKDDRYIAIEQKKALLKPGETLDKDDEAYAAAWDLYVNKRIIDPIRARAAANADDRYVQVMDRENPEKVTFMRAGDAARYGVGSPQSIGFQTDKAVTRYMTAGPGGVNIGYFNTATSHLKLLGETAEALNNGDIQRVNQVANIFARETGDPAPTNFETVRAAVAGELSKTFKGTGATDQEISEINQTINQAESPEQLRGSINYYTRLMDGKLTSLKQQFEQGKHGKPAFTPTPGAGGGAAAKTYKSYARNPQNQHRIGTDDDPHSPNAKWYDAETGKLVQ